jgi:hypothetical protein
MAILRYLCQVPYITPGGGTLNLPMNCAHTDTSSWNWRYFHTKTIGDPPVTTNGIQRDTSGWVAHTGSAIQGQTVLRAIYAYVSTEDVSVQITMEADAGTYGGQQKSLKAILFNPDGSEITTFFDSNVAEITQTVTLPATVCPKVLWLGAAAQPTAIPGFPIPNSSASIETRVV